MSYEAKRLRTEKSVHMTQSPSLSVSIADITYTTVSVDSTLRIQIQGATRNFLVNKATPDLKIEARWYDLSTWDNLSTIETRSKKVFDSGTLWQLYKENGTFMSQKDTYDNNNPPSPPFSKGGQGGITGGLKGFSEQTYIFCFTSPAFGSIPYKIAKVNKDFSSGEVLLHRPYFDPGKPIYPLEYPLDELLFINYLSLGKGVEVHACGIIDPQGNGHLFIGQSGAGKSTMARLWQDETSVTILSDDRIILRKMENKIWMYGTPWHGEAGFALPARAPLTHIYFLTQGTKNELIPQRPTESIARLFACSFVPFYNPEGIDFTLRFFEDVVKTVPSYELRFVPEKQVVELIQTMNNGMLE